VSNIYDIFFSHLSINAHQTESIPWLLWMVPCKHEYASIPITIWLGFFWHLSRSICLNTAGWSGISSCNFLRNLHTDFHVRCINLYHSVRVRFPCILPSICCYSFDDGHSDWGENTVMSFWFAFPSWLRMLKFLRVFFWQPIYCIS
jgi:hypothetical protein